MSSKAKSTAMTEEATPSLVPKLRFPEFIGVGDWEKKYIGDFFNVGSSKRVLQQDWIAQGIPFYRTRELVSLSKNERFSSEIFISKSLFEEITQKYGAPREDDFLISGVGTLGISYMVKKGDEFYFKDGNVIWFSRKGGISSQFFKYCFESDVIQNQIIKQSSVSTVGTYTIQNAKITKFYCPTTEKEQHKIAECLGSVDELIAAQARKVGALKTHKNALMQQLFPREGETQPRFRFPEFQSTVEWQKKPLGSLCRIRTGKKDANEGAADGTYPFFTCAEKHIYSHSYSFDAEAILVAGNANVGQTSYYNGKFEAYQRTYVLTDFEGIFVPYLYSVLNANLRPDLLAQVQTSAMSYIRLPMLQEYPICAPSSQVEQERIASCLSSLDALITAEAQKLEALKTHKKGLMQQLFPSAAEPAA